MQTRSETISAMPSYTFLSQPPQEFYPSPDPASQARSARRRSLAAISNWASSVQPGAPAPASPTKIQSVQATTSRPAEVRAARRHSVKPVAGPAPPSPMEYIPDSPGSSDQSVTPTTKPDFKRDLQTGYTSVYVTLPDGHVPTTPTSPTAPTAPAPSRRGLTRLFKPSSSSSSATASSSKDKAKEKKKKYDEARPVPLATDLALAQLLGGGTMEHHIRQAAEKEAKRAGAKKVNGQYVGVGVMHRDAEGRVWRDEDEELEYAGLLGRESRRAESQDWVRFSEDSGHTSSSSSAENHENSRRHGKSRRRPEPLDLAPSRPHGSHRTYAVDSVDARREFLQSSFVPTAAAMESQASLDTGKKSGLKMSMKSMFKKSSH